MRAPRRWPLLVMVAALTACTAEPAPQQPGRADGTTTTASADPSLEASVELHPGHNLVGRLLVDTDGPSKPEITVSGHERSFPVPVTRAARRHEIPVVGLRSEQEYRIEVRDGDDVVMLELRTGPVPDDFPRFDIAVTEPDRMSAGFTLFNLLDVTDQLGGEPRPTQEPPRSGYLVAVDDAGEVVWYHRSDHPIGDVRQLPDGTLLHEYNDTGARRIDLTGRTVQEWAGQIITGPLRQDAYGRQVAGDGAIEVATDSMHHEVGMLPDGNLVALSTELRTVGGFPLSGLCDEPDGIDGSYDLIVDVVVEFAPDGEIVHAHSLADYFDPVGDPRDQNVCGLPFDQVFPNWLYRAQGFDEALDWTHANAVVLDPSERAFTVSIRHLDAVIHIDRDSGELLWRFGPGGDFTIDDPADFAYHQHAVEWQDDGTLLLYDNGNGRPAPAGSEDPAPAYSRAVQYRLDPDAGTAEVVWQYRSELDGEPLFAAFVGDADRLGNGNVLITNGGLDAGRDDDVTAQIVEIVPDPFRGGGEAVFELRVADPGRNWVIYRSERLPTFYPVASNS